MFKTKRKRAVVMALIAFFCTAATTYVAVDWKRFGGGFLAFLKGGKSDSAVASMGGASASKGERMVAGDNTRAHDAPLPRLAAAGSRKHPSGAGGNGGKSEEDLFKYGDPAAGGIPPGSFIVAQNDTPAGSGGGAPEIGGTPTDGGGPGVSSPAPAPGGTTGGPDDTGLHGTGKTPAASPPPDTPPSPPPTDTPPSPPPSLPPVSSIPESSPLAMMSLGALFLAVAAARKRQQG